VRRKILFSVEFVLFLAAVLLRMKAEKDKKEAG